MDNSKKGDCMAKVSLKTQNIPLISIYIIAIYAVNVILASKADLSLKGFGEWFEKLNTNKVIIAVMPLLLFILLNIVPTKIKEAIAFLRFTNVLPGTRVFSNLIQNDNRIDNEMLKLRIGDFPKKADSQNAKWYEIFRSIKDCTGVESSHKAYLLARELSFIAFSTLLVTILLMLARVIPFSLTGSIFAVANYLLMVVVCNNVGNRFALNVIAEYLTKKT